MRVNQEHLTKTATAIRELIIKSLLNAGSGHTAGSLGMSDVFTALYFAIIKHRPTEPDWQDRDRVILSNGHICPAWYATLATAGYFDQNLLDTLREFSSPLQGHPHRGSLPGIENTSGPLGQGISLAAGLASAFKLDGKKQRVYVLTSDGEQQEGQTWEAYWYAGVNRLSNLTVLIDRNNIQIDGHTEDVMPLQPFKSKLESFRFNVLSIDGHNFEAIINACHQAAATQEQPTAIICHTTPGKGVEFMENLPEWHGKPPDAGETIEALHQLRSLRGRIDCEA